MENHRFSIRVFLSGVWNRQGKTQLVFHQAIFQFKCVKDRSQLVFKKVRDFSMESNYNSIDFSNRVWNGTVNRNHGFLIRGSFE